jgi:hypothetical protein
MLGAMAAPAALSPSARIAFGLLCIAAGVVPVLASFDVGPLDSSAINGPRWLGFLAGGIFIAAGVALMGGERLRHSALSYGLFALVISSFACIASWIAFGPGPRDCAIAVAGLLTASGMANEIACRTGFGIGALLLDGFVLVMIARALQVITGPGLLPRAVEKMGGALVILALAPIFLPMMLFGFAKIFVEGFATWRATGRWPRNEAFIRRMKAKRAAKS